MEILSQILKLLYRNKYWLVLLPLFATVIAIFQTKNLTREYKVDTTIYTGIASGFTIESGMESGRVDWSSVNNGMDNLISIIKSKSTLRNVSIRLYVQHMIYGDSINDNNYILAQNYRELLKITPKDVRALIDKSSAENTIQNLNNYEKASSTNFVYGLFNWNHPHYSFEALSNIEVSRIYNSDMLEISYTANDPGIAFNTLIILNDEFAKQYKLLRFGETNDVVEYFRNELALLSLKLRNTEDSLTEYSIAKKVINYSEQTKQVTALAKDFEIMYYDILLKYTSSSTMVVELEKRISEQAKSIENNTIFLNKLETISQLSSQIARLEAFQNDSSATFLNASKKYKENLKIAEEELRQYSTSIMDNKYTKEGVASTTFVDQWITELIEKEKSTSGLKVMEEIKKSLDDQYVYYSPIGSTLKRIERNISFTEQSYLSVLQSLNTALLRQKTLQMNSANLKPLNPPLFPISPMPTARKMIVLSTLIGTFIFVLTFLILLEIFDRTLRDKVRTENLVSAKVLGAFPRRNRFRYRSYWKEIERIATNYMANSIIPYLNPKEKPDIINFISTEDGVGKSKLIENLASYWSERGLIVRVISWHDSDLADSREFLLSSNLYDFFDYDNEDLILVEHRSILKSAIPAGLLKEASLNLVILRADKVWRDIDKIAFERLKEQASKAPLMLYLNQANREVTESFLGLLPPFSMVKAFIYKMMQFGLTSK
ncbi:MAG: exopolysaccharide biosynthesis protein [Bacteroidales bacterium]|nr:exopolysaccharide biosynthesis protein [Bacteroidales bacterium]MDD4491086.1 exopolysaccharide biosynthesis protein [Bacteroidales bacterium]